MVLTKRLETVLANYIVENKLETHGASTAYNACILACELFRQFELPVQIKDAVTLEVLAEYTLEEASHLLK